MSRYIKRHIISVASACLLLLFNSLLQVFAATKMAELANYLIVKNIKRFGQVLILIFVLWLISFIISFLENYVQENVTQDILSDIRKDIAASLITIPQSKFKQKPADYYESYLQNDVNLIQKEGVNTFFLIIRFSGNAIFSLIALYVYSYILFITAILLVALIVMVPRFLKRYLTTGVEEISRANEKFLKYSSSGLHGYETLYAFNALREIKKLVEKGSSALKKANVHNTVRRSIVDIITGVINIGSQLLILGITGFLHFQGELSAGAILSTAELATKVFDSAGIINRYFAQLLSTSSIFKKFANLSNQAESEPKPFNQTVFSVCFDSLEFKNVSFTYSNTDKKILSDFSYIFTKGNLYKLNGESGRGKSTLLKLATHQLLPDKGTILLNGVDINTIPQYIINSIIIWVPQVISIFPQSIDYNIALGRKVDAKQIIQAKQSFGINDHWSYDSLSGGEEQRVALARLIDTKGKLILLDESFSSIDLETTQELMKSLLSQVDSLILISHRNEEISGYSFENLSMN